MENQKNQFFTDFAFLRLNILEAIIYVQILMNGEKVSCLVISNLRHI